MLRLKLATPVGRGWCGGLDPDQLPGTPGTPHTQLEPLDPTLLIRSGPARGHNS